MRVRKLVSRFGPWVLLIGSASGLIALVLTVQPDAIGRLAFLGLLFTGCFALAFLIFRAYYGRRSSAAQQRDPHRPAREAIMIAGFVALCAWLQMLRILTLINALLLLGVLTFMEAFWVSRAE